MSRLIIDEDFAGPFTNWFFDGVGTDTQTHALSETNAPGIISLGTGTSTNDTCRAVYSGDGATSQLIMANQVAEFSCRFRLNDLTNVRFQFGLFDDPAGASGSAVARYCLFDSSVSASMFSFSANAGSDFMNTGVAPSTTLFRTFRAKISGDGELAAWQILDEAGAVLARGIHDANFVDATPVYLMAEVTALAASLRSARIDRIYVRSKELAR